jgi:hypothetical protein
MLTHRAAKPIKFSMTGIGGGFGLNQAISAGWAVSGAAVPRPPFARQRHAGLAGVDRHWPAVRLNRPPVSGMCAPLSGMRNPVSGAAQHVSGSVRHAKTCFQAVDFIA